MSVSTVLLQYHAFLCLHLVLQDLKSTSGRIFLTRPLDKDAFQNMPCPGLPHLCEKVTIKQQAKTKTKGLIKTSCTQSENQA